MYSNLGGVALLREQVNTPSFYRNRTVFQFPLQPSGALILERESPITLDSIVTVMWMETVPFGQMTLKWPVTWCRRECGCGFYKHQRHQALR